MKAPSFYSDPHVQFLSQLLEEISEGGMQVPRFQRPLVWRWDRRLELLRSIRDGIPIGSVMVWRTNDVAIECYERLGPYRLRTPSPNSTRQYILDGVQRLSTLYGALHRPNGPTPTEVLVSDISDAENDFEDGEEEESFASEGTFDVFYDPSTNDFLSGDEIDRQASLMPLSLVFDSVALLRFQRAISEDLVEATDQLVRSFRDYKLPVIPITTEDVNLATRTFQRINSQGVRMSEAHMVHALTWTPHFDLQKRLRESKAAVLADRGWDGLDDDTILKCCKAACGLDVYKASADELSAALVKSPAILTQVFSALGGVADFARTRCGIPTPDLMPYALQIVVLAEALRLKAQPSEQVVQLLTAWFWMTTYGELFAGMSGDRVQLAILDMHAMVTEERATWTWKRPFEQRPLRPTFDFRAARAKAFAFRLAALQDAVFGGRCGSHELADSGRKAVTQILPWKQAGPRAYSSPGNRFLVKPVLANDFREKLLNDMLSTSERAAHCISNEASHALMRGDYNQFVEIRAKDMVELETSFLTPLIQPFMSLSRDRDFGAASIHEQRVHNLTTIVRASPNEVYFTVGELTTPIRVRLTEIVGHWVFQSSHAIQTPLQTAPYWTSRPYAESRDRAIELATDGIGSFYLRAIDSGFVPSEAWLVPAADSP